jgi:hypothetical protein
MRRLTLVAAVALALAALVPLAVPGAAEAIRKSRIISIDASGLQQPVVRIGIGQDIPVWFNRDTVPRTVRFLNGRCTLVLQPGDDDFCRDQFWERLGVYRYEVAQDGGTVTGVLAIVRWKRTVTMRAALRAVPRGQAVVLSGTAFAERWGMLGPPTPPVVVSRRTRDGRLVRVARVMAVRWRDTRRTADYPDGFWFTWKVRLRPFRTATYVAQIVAWRDRFEHARSRPIKVRVE